MSAHLHIDYRLHQEFKAWCKSRGERMKDTAESLIRQMLAVERAAGRRAEEAQPTNKEWQKPPFWENR